MISKKALKEHFAGKHIPYPEKLPIGTNVTVFQKGTEGCFGKMDSGWFEHGVICKIGKAVKINCFDGYYDLKDVIVFLDSRYIHSKKSYKNAIF